MSTYVIEREIPGIGNSTQDEFKAISQSSGNVLSKLSSEIKWNRSYVNGNKIYCIYDAPSEELILEHAKQGGFPGNSVSRFANVNSSATAG